jgi:hypothetical protein
VEEKMAEIFSLTLRTGSCLLEAAAVATTVGYATTNNATTNKCYNEQILSIKSGWYKEHRCYNEQFLSRKSGGYNERGGILSADVTRAWALRVWPSRFD